MSAADLAAHLASGATTVCRAWKVRRCDGESLGFTDHDGPLYFDGLEFKANSGLTARALQQSTGLSVDNTEAVGALSDDALREEDILAGRYDTAEVTAFLVNWANPEMRMVLFRGTFGEVSRQNGQFTVELRGLSEPLNRQQGRVFQSGCSAILGDSSCRVDLERPEFRLEAVVDLVSSALDLNLNTDGDHPDRWFDLGTLSVLTGPARGLSFPIGEDRRVASGRRVILRQGLVVWPLPGDRVAITAGCDGRATTCRERFANFENFRGFPHIPGDDWLKRFPSAVSG